MANGPSRMPLHLLESMTDNFSPDRVLGSGAYGQVYLGKRPEDGQKIAVKILHGMPGHGDEQFEKEFYNLANLKHQNIVRLVGFCHETRRELLPYNGAMVFADLTKRALCFEFMENGSLSDRLFDESTGQGWHTRYAMIKGICNGLKYLHEELEPPIFHLDLKPANILLDQNMIPKIADFGLSRFFKEEKSYITNSPIGTLGYLPREFIDDGIISNKLDIFSLGVVVIKIIAGPTGHCRSAETTAEKFIEIVHVNWRDRLQSTASGDLLESYSKQVKICMEIALSCLEADRQKRPTIGDIVNKLTGTETLENYHEALIDQIDVHPLQLHFSFRPNKLMCCPFHVTNNLNDEHVSVRCVPKHEEATPRYYTHRSRIVVVVPPRSTHTFVVTMKQTEQPPANMDVLDMVVETILGEVSDDSFDTHLKDARKENSCGFREVTLKAVCATTSKMTTSEVMLDDGCLWSMDVRPTEPWSVHGSWITSFAVHPTQPFVLSASSDELIKLWDYEKGWECIRTFTGHSHWVNQVKFNPHDANTFASASGDGTVKIWRIFSPIHVTSLKCEESQGCVDYYPTATGGDQQHYMVTGSRFFLGSGSGMARIWDLRTQTCIREIKGLQLLAHSVVGVIDCHPDRPALLITASADNGVSLVDSTTYRCERTIHFRLGEVVCFAYIKSIRSIAIGHYSGVAIMDIDEFYKNVSHPAR